MRHLTPFIELEGLPEGLSSFWLRPDIYTRMDVMIERSDAFVIFPGGSGTVQEMIALMIFKHQGHASAGKPVIVYNRRDESGIGFWDPLIAMLGAWCREDEFTVVDDFDDLLPTVGRLVDNSVRTAGSSVSERRTMSAETMEKPNRLVPCPSPSRAGQHGCQEPPDI